jgi:[protein-PII] uridylyltransferase
MAVVAVGGYGRRELCPKSDLDLLFLHHYKVDPYVEAMTESMLYPLWDLGFEVGHSVRNVKETIRLAGQDDSIRTALMDHRMVAGDEAFFREAGKDLERFLYYTGGDRFIETKIREMRSRHARVGASSSRTSRRGGGACGTSTPPCGRRGSSTRSTASTSCARRAS